MKNRGAKALYVLGPIERISSAMHRDGKLLLGLNRFRLGILVEYLQQRFMPLFVSSLSRNEEPRRESPVCSTTDRTH